MKSELSCPSTPICGELAVAAGERPWRPKEGGGRVKDLARRHVTERTNVEVGGTEEVGWRGRGRGRWRWPVGHG